MLIDIHTHKAIPDSTYVHILSLYKDLTNASVSGHCSIGIHPCYLDHYDHNLALLAKLATLDNVLAIGECGLDTVCNKNEQLQKEVFKEQVLLADAVKKPLIIHCVRAFDNLLRIMAGLGPGIPAVIHGYNKKSDIANRLLDAGMYLSFGAAIMNGSSPAAEVLANMPADRFFLETDDANTTINEIYEHAARIRKIDPETLILQLQHNFKEVFKRNI